MAKTVKKLLGPKVLIPAILTIGVIAALLAFGNVGKVIALMAGFNRLYLIWFFLAMIAYTVVRGVQWHYLLRAPNVRAPLRAQVFAFLMGEMTKSLPIGNYFQNYILERSRGTDFGRTSAASTIVIITEVGVSLLGCVLIGVGGWAWVRPVILLGVGGFMLVCFIFSKVHDPTNPPRWITSRKTFRTVLDEFNQFRDGAHDLAHPRILLIESALSAIYLVIAGTGLWLVARGLGISGISYVGALAVYFFSLAVGLILPIPIDFGVVEISGTGALLAIGVSKTGAVGIMLINRFLSLASALVIALLGMVIFRDELRKALEERPKGNKRGRRPSQGQPERDAANEALGEELGGEHEQSPSQMPAGAT
ncbi:MAG: flippase-like domain-containing protein [Ktedonobacterales bacterium]|nr:flippase-like domain-containing protein [Ktedonobacterales bacterium]